MNAEVVDLSRPVLSSLMSPAEGCGMGAWDHLPGMDWRYLDEDRADRPLCDRVLATNLAAMFAPVNMAHMEWDGLGKEFTKVRRDILQWLAPVSEEAVLQTPAAGFFRREALATAMSCRLTGANLRTVLQIADEIYRFYYMDERDDPNPERRRRPGRVGTRRVA